jgi:hypothetical protein
MIPELWQISCDYLGFSDQLNLLNINKEFNKKLYIRELYRNIPRQTRVKLNDNILQQSKYRKLEVLYATHNPNITNVNHLTNLKVLHASGYCGITNNGIRDLVKLGEVHVIGSIPNNKITK